MKRALITGITGQDGSYLAELLLKKGYEVHGIMRRSSSFNTGRIEHLYEHKFKTLFLHYGDLVDPISIDSIMKEVMPEEVYHLAAQSHVWASFEMPDYTGKVDALGTLYVLEAIKKHCPRAKFYNATTSELFGKVQEIPQKETTPFYPRSPYGVAKLYSYWIAKNYKEAYDLFVCNGILFNHESPRRGKTFVTMKVISKLVEIAKYEGNTSPLYIGNMEARRDWGYTPEFVEGMWLMMQQDNPDDYVLSTGETHSVRELIELSADMLNLNLKWRGSGEMEVGYSKYLNKEIIKIDPVYYRPTEVDLLVGDPSKAKEKLGWEAKTKFKDLVKIMMDHELNS